jgi:hypothetical protein
MANRTIGGFRFGAESDATKYSKGGGTSSS